MDTYGVGIVGAGPCGIACALKLSEQGVKVVIIEEGKEYHSRKCFADDGGKCMNCNRCSVISGFGGCVHYGDSAKLSYHPSGKELFRKLGDDYDRICDEACSIWGVSKKDFLNGELDGSRYGLEIKNYPVRVITSQEIRNRIEYFKDRLDELGVTFIWAEMKTFRECSEGFNVEISDGNSIFCRKLVLALGRGGMKWLEGNATLLGIEYCLPVSTIGVRFEMPKKYLMKLGEIHPDLKIRLTNAGYKYKTFCYCAGKNGGRLKFANYGDYTLLDGHVLTETDLESEYGNFALLKSLIKIGESAHECKNRVQEVLIEYKKISSGKPIFQRYYDFKNEIDSKQTIELSSKNVMVGPVYKLLLGETKAFCTVAEKVLEFIANSANVSLNTIENSTNVIGLELEGLWNKIYTDTYCMTSIQNLYVGGDCGGEVQGILQATMEGIRIAENIVQPICN